MFWPAVLERVGHLGAPVARARAAAGVARVARSGALGLAAAAVLQAAVFVPIGVLRALDPDEGWYAYAAQRVFHGDLPYRDFFFPQTPLLPYLYGAWFEVFGATWYSGRALGVLITIATGLLVYRYCVVRFGRPSRSPRWSPTRSRPS
jgi:hypothetical protein